MKRKTIPCALTIAGSDSGGGAGIQADLKTFAALGVHGASAVTCVTAQNPKQVVSVHPLPAQIVRDQIATVLSGFSPRAIKTGMLYSAEIIECAVEALAASKAPLIVDPVLISTSGAELLRHDAVTTLREKLLPRATLVTPNLPELAFLIGRKITTPEELRAAGRELFARYQTAVLAKGGHLAGNQAIDFFFDGTSELLLEAPRTRGVLTHGTGCTYSAAIAAFCALGFSVRDAVVRAKTFISNAIANSAKSNRHFVLAIHPQL